MSTPLRLIVGLGNPGEQYARTRHNAGVWFVARFAEQLGAQFKNEKKFFRQVATVNYLLQSQYITGRTLHLDGGRHLV